MRVRFAIAGGLWGLGAVALCLAAFAWFGATEGVFGPLARMLDALTPVLAALALGLGGLAAVLGLRRAGFALCLGAALACGLGVLSFRALSVPLASTAPDLRILFFNARAENTASAEAIVAATLKARPDIAFFAEAKAVLPALSTLREYFSFVSECPENECEILVAANPPVTRFWRLQLNPAWPARYAVLELEGTSGAPIFVTAVHLVKPWMSGLARPELAQLQSQYNWLQGPSVAVGDFNMPVWSKPMRALLEATGFRALRGQPASWPSGAGRFGLPIDHALARGGAQVVGIAPFGQDLGSNHRGFVADIALSGR